MSLMQNKVEMSIWRKTIRKSEKVSDSDPGSVNGLFLMILSPVTLIQHRPQSKVLLRSTYSMKTVKRHELDNLNLKK